MWTLYKIQKWDIQWKVRLPFFLTLQTFSSFFWKQPLLPLIHSFIQQILLSTSWILGTVLVFAVRGWIKQAKIYSHSQRLPFYQGWFKVIEIPIYLFRNTPLWCILIWCLKRNVTYHITVLHLAFFHCILESIPY